MKDQITLTDVEYGNRKKTTKREEFLNKMEEIIPWKAWVEMIRPYYPKGEHGRPVRGIETMLRMYLMQTWFNLSDEGTEDAIYDSYAMRSFLGINFMTEQVPDATTLLKFRHLLEKHNIGEKIFTDIRDRLEESGLLMHGGTIVDATIISAPSSTKNRTKRGNKHLRKVIYEVCLSYIQHKPEGDPVYEFIEKKRSEGKCGKEALVAGINKFLRIYYGKVTDLYRELEI